MSETGEYELFISIDFQQHEIYKERQARFERESSEILKEEFTVIHKGRHLHHNVGHDTTYYLEGSVIVSSIKTIYYLEVVLPLSS